MSALVVYVVVPLIPVYPVGVILIFPLSNLKVPAMLIDITGDVLRILVSEKVDPLNTIVSSSPFFQVPWSGVFVVVVVVLLDEDESEPFLHEMMNRLVMIRLKMINFFTFSSSFISFFG